MNKALISRPIAVSMCMVALVVLGVLCLHRIPVSLMPEIDIPEITVQVSLPGYSAREVERNVVAPLRGRLMQVGGLADIRSEARMDAGSVKLTFEPGSDVDLLFIEVNEKVDRAMNQMPKEMNRPKVMKAGAMDIPAFFLDILPENPSHFPQTCKFARNVVVKRIEQLPQTAMVDMSGTVGTEIACVPDEGKLRAMGLTVEHIEQAIQRNNITLEALSVVDGLYRYNIHFDSQLLTREDIENIYINHQGRLLQLKELCDIREVTAQRNGLVRHNGREAVTLAIIKQNDARMDELQESMDNLLNHMRKEYPDLRFELTRDQTRLLSYTLENLESNLYAGAVMTCLVLLLFLRRWRLSLLVVLSIPLSLIITILCFYLLGISLNVISLSGLILGVGMMVDNAIIVVDNITAMRAARKDLSLTEATVTAVREVSAPMLSSVLTTCSVFVPLIFLSGTAGALFYDQAMGVTTALFASLLVATVVVPVYYVALHRKGKGEQGWMAPQTSRKAVGAYEAVMKWTLRHSGLCLLLFVACVPLTAVLLYDIEKERMPQVEQEETLLNIDWNSNISAEENDRRVKELMAQIQAETVTATSMVGAQDFMLAHTRDITASEAVIYIKAQSVGHLKQVRNKVIDFLKKHYPQAAAEFGETGNLYDLIFSTDEADLSIHLQDRDGGRPAVEDARAFRDSLEKHFPHLHLAPVRTEMNIRYVADAEQMALYKVDFGRLYARLRELVNRNCIFRINEGADHVPVLVSADNRGETHLLEETVKNAEGTDVPLRYLVKESKGEDYKRLLAGNGGEYYAYDLEAEDSEVERVMDYVNAYVRRPESKATAYFTGGYFSGRKLIGELTVVLAVALALLYFILAAQFESLVQPFIILLEMVVDVCFVVLGLWLCGETLNMMSMTGIVVMSGIIINDSILKIDTINHSRHRYAPTKLGLAWAIMEAGQKRLRPIVMTSLTTILALLPFLNKDSMGAAIQYPLSLALIIGMTVGTLVSLFFVPMTYYIIYRKRK